MIIKRDSKLEKELGINRSLIVIVLKNNYPRKLSGSEILEVLPEYFQTLSSIAYHLDWLVRNTQYVQKNSVSIGRIKKHTYHYNGH